MAQGPRTLRQPATRFDGQAFGTLRVSTADFAGTGESTVVWCTTPPTASYNGVLYYFSHWEFSGILPTGWNAQSRTNTSAPYNIYQATDTLVVTAYYKSEGGGGGGGGTRFKVITASSPLDAADTTGGGEYDYGASCTINTTVKAANKDKYKFVCWKSSNGDEVKTERHTFTVTSDITWVAQYAKIEHSGLVIYNPSNNQVIHSPQTNLVMYDANPDS